MFFLKVGKSVEYKKKKIIWYLELSSGSRFLSVFLFMSSWDKTHDFSKHLLGK